MSLNDVQYALQHAVSQCLQGWPLAEENKPFRPQGGRKWAAVHFLPRQPAAAALGSDAADEVRGIVQIDLNYPPGLGTDEARRDFELVRQCFHAGTRLARNGREVLIINCGRAAGQNLDGFYRVPITISWFAHIERR